MANDDGNPYQSPVASDVGNESRASTRRVLTIAVLLHLIVTSNFGVAVGWMYLEALKPAYPLAYTPPLGLPLYFLTSFLAALPFALCPAVLAAHCCRFSWKEGWSLSLNHVWLLLSSIILSGLEMWLFSVVDSPPIHAI